MKDVPEVVDKETCFGFGQPILHTALGQLGKENFQVRDIQQKHSDAGQYISFPVFMNNKRNSGKPNQGEKKKCKVMIVGTQ